MLFVNQIEQFLSQTMFFWGETSISIQLYFYSFQGVLLLFACNDFVTSFQQSFMAHHNSFYINHPLSWHIGKSFFLLELITLYDDYCQESFLQASHFIPVKIKVGLCQLNHRRMLVWPGEARLASITDDTKTMTLLHIMFTLDQPSLQQCQL